MHLTTSAADFSKETLVVKEEETYDAGVFERVEAEVVKLLKEPQSLFPLSYFWKRGRSLPPALVSFLPRARVHDSSNDQTKL